MGFMFCKEGISFVIIAVCFAVFIMLVGCDGTSDPVSPDDMTPTPGASPTPFATPTPAPTPDSDMWGYINGSARVRVEGLPYIYPEDDIKATIFHLYHPTTRAWLNIRHRAYNKFQPKGSLDYGYGCHDEINWHYMKEGGNGVWNIVWEQRENTTWVRVTSPEDESVELNFIGGAAAWREIRTGSGDARIPFNAPATVTVLEMSGDIGEAVYCHY
jgi:hypothetical protein